MVQLKVLSGTMAGAAQVARRFPVRIGRGSADLKLEDPGVWDNHAELQLIRSEGFAIVSAPEAITRINGQEVKRGLLRNGDVIEVGGVKLQFWLSETQQTTLQFREMLTWFLIGSAALGQVGIIYWLLSK